MNSIRYLMNNHDLLDASEVVVSGGSAGGLAAFSWVDVIASFFNKGPYS